MMDTQYILLTIRNKERGYFYFFFFCFGFFFFKLYLLRQGDIEPICKEKGRGPTRKKKNGWRALRVQGEKFFLKKKGKYTFLKR